MTYLLCILISLVWSTVDSQSITVVEISVSIKDPDLAFHCTILPCVQAAARIAVMGTDN